MWTTICTTANTMMTSAAVDGVVERAASSPARTGSRSGSPTGRSRSDNCRAAVRASADAMVVRRARRDRARVRDACRSSQHSQQIDEGEDADPDDVEEVPEHADRHMQAALVRGDQPVRPIWTISHQPDQAERDVQPVRADQREEGGQERAALRRRRLRRSGVENSYSSMPTNARPNRPVIASQTCVARDLAVVHRQHREAVGDRREQQHRGVHARPAAARRSRRGCGPPA